MEVYFNDNDDTMSTQESVDEGRVDKESGNLSAVANEITDVKENFYWNNQNTKLLLHLFQERKEKFRDPKVKKKSLWTEIMNKFKEHNYSVTEDILDRKMRNMKKTYRTIKDNQKLSGRGRITWEYFDSFEHIFLDDKTINIGPTLSSMQHTFQLNSEQIADQRDSGSDMINVQSTNLKTHHYNSSSKDSSLSVEHTMPSQNSRLPSKYRQPLSEGYISTSRDSRISSIDTDSSDCFDLIFSKEGDCSNPDDSQSLLSIEDQSEEDKRSSHTLSNRKPHSMKDNAVRSRALFQHRRKNEHTEIERVKEIKELRKTIEKNNEIQEQRNKLLQDLIEEFKAKK